MGTDNVIFLEVLEWFDETGEEIVHRIPEGGSGEIKFGAQLTVRESQAAVFYYQGKAYDAFGPGRHTLKTANIPILTKVLSIPWAMKSPLRAEAYFVNMKVFPNLRWGTKNPVAFKDSELGLIRLRAFGIFNIRVLQPVLFINNLVGTQGVFTTEDIEEFLGRVIISRFNDHLGEHLDSVLNLPGRYDELSGGLTRRLEEDFSHYGLGLAHLYITSITPPPEVQKAIDDKSRLGVFDDLNKLLKMKAAMAVEKISEQQGEAGAGIGMGMGFMMPAIFSDYLSGQGGTGTSASADSPAGPVCPDCHNPVARDARFCPSCGHQIVVFQQCQKCGKNLPPNAGFCSHCGAKVETTPRTRKCPHCGTENLKESVFCNHCGERL
ncbi:double zinc ribbon [bacterium BMS3Abin07]|nr:double zinc ribbon [bacterium BMS3Abin07]GBE33172.1 double zinc ribbon [bacterium BMS3Bbin05]HDL19760.1 SPFH domain-containing protein [Nitrospirota bacterium]HDO22996.1 SPFH domain-containing protein [Nitrospirota bacterium]HDZ87610.1 SPFH domain-containing protein [Nitrospirota bacterium]